MIVFLSCYVWGEGYTTKKFSFANGALDQCENNAMGIKEKTVFLKSHTKLLLANVSGKRFGFVRDIRTGKKDEQNRECMINIAFQGSSNEVDPFMQMAEKDYPGFAQNVRKLVEYKGEDFTLNQSALGTFLQSCLKYGVFEKTDKPVLLLATEMSTSYFLKYSDIGWKEADIYRELEMSAFKDETPVVPQCTDTTVEQKTNVSRHPELSVFLYCPSPTVGWVLRQIDPYTGSEISTGVEAKNKMSELSIMILTNYGCQSALFEDGGRYCFIVKDVKAEKLDQYGQKKTVSLVLESKTESLLVKQLAAYALLDYPTFSRLLLDCVKITARPIGFTVDGDKLGKLFDMLEGAKTPSKSDARYAEWNQIVNASGKKFIFLNVLATLDYFQNAIQMDLSKSDILLLRNNNKSDNSRAPLMLETLRIWTQVPEGNPTEKTLPTSASVGMTTEKLTIIECPETKTEAEQKVSAQKNTNPNDSDQEVSKEKSEETANDIESVDLLTVKGFRVALGICAVLLIGGLTVLLCLYGKGMVG